MSAEGSEWARWDLHVHSPLSIVQSYGKGGGDPWENFIADLESLPADFKVIGINDYLFLDGYRRVIEYKESGRLQNIDLVLPVMEFRLNHFGGTDGNLSRLNLHVVFSDALGPDLIQQQFVNGLKCDLTLLPAGVNNADWASLLTRDSLEALGSAFKETLSDELKKQTHSDLQEGFNNYNVSFETVVDLLESNPLFKNKYFLAVGKAEWADIKWNKQSAAFKKTLINRPHFVFTAADTPAAFLKSREALTAAGVNATLLDCSDAHFLSSANQALSIGNCMTWINAAPTFEGLRHAYHEYDSRVFVGDVPPKLESVKAHPTAHMSHVSVAPTDGSTPTPLLQLDLPINAGFVAIVGNKGKGKSALTDVLGLLGDGARFEDYSFLHRKRFCDPKDNKAAQHQGTLRWCSGKSNTQTLDHTPDPTSLELVQYLPQSFLESVCNEGPGSDALFSQELSDVIFSHVPEEDRLGTSTLSELVAQRSSASTRKIEILRQELADTIHQIVDLERLADPRTKQHLQNQLKAKEAELAAHDSVKPTVVEPPDPGAGATTEMETSIEDVRRRIVELEDTVNQLQSEANSKTQLVEHCNDLVKEIENFQHQYQTFVERVGPIAERAGLPLAALVKLDVDVAQVREALTIAEEVRRRSTEQLVPSAAGTTARALEDARGVLRDLEAELDAPRRAYQTYLTDVAEWERQRAAIVGTASTPETTEHFKDRLAQLADVPDRVETLRDRRRTQALAIHAELITVSDVLRESYAPVQGFIDEHPVVRDRFSLSFEVTLIESGLAERFFAIVNRQVNGSFSGTEEGNDVLSNIIDRTDFNSPSALEAFLDSIDDSLRFDRRTGRSGKATQVLAQVRKGHTPEDLYRLIFGLEYLSPEFWLRSGELPISQLSPGQRGTLLLLFYLLVDKSQRPIILDQPEENLDNQTVHELLAPAIAEARNTRQVVVVTHNPNLAVVGDADQVIVADLSQAEFSYVSGAIEDPEINRRIVDILEGTWPAFQNRQDKYIPTWVLDTE